MTTVPTARRRATVAGMVSTGTAQEAEEVVGEEGAVGEA